MTPINKCRHNGPGGPCGILFDGDKEGFLVWDCCALHVSDSNRQHPKTAARIKERTDTLLSRLFSEPQVGTNALQIVDATFPAENVFPSVSARSLSFSACKYHGVNALNGIKEIKGSLLISQSLINAKTSLEGVSIDGSLSIIDPRNAESIDLTNVRVTDSLSLDIQAIDTSIRFKQVIAKAINVKSAHIVRSIGIEDCHVREFANLSSLRIRTFQFMGTVCKVLKLESSNVDSIHIADTSVIEVLNMQNLSSQKITVSRLTVSNVATFKDIHAPNGANFLDVTFKGPVDWTCTESENNKLRWIKFEQTEFRSLVDFRNWIFTDWMDFTGARFSCAPQFHGCGFHQDIRFPSEECFTDWSSEHAPAAYRTLKQEMEKLRARREEGMFFALEQRSIRNTSRAMSSFERFTSRCYDVATHYGQSYGRPLILLGVVYTLFALIYAAMQTGIHMATPNWPAIRTGFLWSLEHSVNPFGVWRKEALKDATDFPWHSLQVIASIESLLAIILIALFLLALRWRFKRD